MKDLRSVLITSSCVILALWQYWDSILHESSGNSFFALPLVILYLVLAITTTLTPALILNTLLIILGVLVPSLLGSLFVFTQVRAKFDARSREFYKSRVMVVRGLHHFHEVRQYLETLPVDFQLFGIGMSLPALLALGCPLIISTLFTIIRLT